MVTMLSSRMDSITTEPPETTFHVMVCCLPLGSLASHCPASAFRLSNDALAFGADKTGTEMAKNTTATASALSFICFLPRSESALCWKVIGNGVEANAPACFPTLSIHRFLGILYG